MKESEFQNRLIRKIRERMPDCIVLKNDPGYLQGVPDLIVLNNDRWGTLECKKTKDSKHQPNQDHYVNRMNRMSYSAFVYPENEKEVLDELQQALCPKR